MTSIPSHILERIQKAKEGQLKTLDLSNDWDTPGADKLTTIPDEVLELTQLESLDLSHNAITSIPKSIARLKNLNKLILYRNLLTELPKEILHIENLFSLNVSGNPLKTVPSWFPKLKNLKELDLSFTGSTSDSSISNLERISGLENLTSLSFNNVGLTTIPRWLLNLQNLEELSLGFNQLTSIPEWLSQLPNLKKLYLNGNRLNTIPMWITGMKHLEELHIGGNELPETRAWISQMKQLTVLDLSKVMSLGSSDIDNKLVNLLEWISELTNLRSLHLNYLRFGHIPDWLFQLKKLEDLNLVGCGIDIIPAWFSQMQELTEINLSGNHLTSISEPVSQLKNLEVLWLVGNKIQTVDDSVGGMQKLTRLGLASNQLQDLPESFSQLQNLKLLYLSSNRFTSIPDVIWKLVALEELRFSNASYEKLNQNQIRELSPKILQLRNLTKFDVANNPIENPPPEIVSRGLNAIKQYFLDLEEGEDHLYEAKLLIVGEGGAGKTTLAKKIQNPAYKLQKEEKSTEGIEVTQWNFKTEDGKPFRVNIWDFGGQEIYHATHQFFLTKRSLYALVADTRKEDTDFYYWLNVVELLSDASPLLIVKNEKQNRHRDINERQLRYQFPGLQKTLSTNLATNRGLDEVLAEFKHYISHLPHIGTPLPKTWVKVRESLEKDSRDYISLDNFLNVCEDNGFRDLEGKLRLSDYLHDLGVCLHFQNDPLLKHLVILKPKWGTDAVYKVLDNKDVIRSLGEFTKSDLKKIWCDQQYANMQDELLQLMINFKLCYKIDGGQTYIAPQLLSENQPHYEWNERDNLILRYKYEFMPKGLLTQLIVALHPLIAEQKYVWKTGIILEKDKTKAEAIEHYGKREITIRVSGAHKKDLLTIVLHELEKLHRTFQRLKYSALIPCNCATCAGSQEPHFYPFETLRRYVADRQEAIQCQMSYAMVAVRGLIDDVIDRNHAINKASDMYGGVTFQGAVDTVILGNPQIGEVNTTMPKMTNTPRSPWISGTFYLFVFAVVITGLGILSNTVSFYVLPLLLVAGIILIAIIGALQFRQDERLSERSFLELMRMSIGQLPLIKRFSNEQKSALSPPHRVQKKDEE